MASTATSSGIPSAIHQNVDPYEVGWQFVPQYYTFVNKHPNRLHCFYTKNSTFIHGTEGEDGRPCFGQQEIHSKILSIGFQDCKVFINSVDAQASAAGGIIIQVIGEMSNRGEAWRKFVQTFFLAEQPNGYFVLNDIFRFLKDEVVEEGDEIAQNDIHAEHVPPTAVELAQPEEEQVPTVNIPSSTPAPPESVSEPDHEVVPDPPATVEISEPIKPQANGVHPVEEKQDEVTVSEPEIVQAEEVETVDEVPPVEEPAPIAQPVQQPTPPVIQPAAPAPQQPTQPAATTPKTWANLAATNPKKWGANVAQESRGTSEAVASSPPASGTQTPVTAASPAPSGRGSAPTRGGHHHHGHHPLYTAALSVNTPQVFVKGVIESVSNSLLQKTLGEYGPLKDFEIVRSKACAFAEYTTVESARRAIIASLPAGQGGDGGIRVDVGEGQPVRITVETKKERGERPPPRPRGGGNAGQGAGERGSFRGGRGGRGRGAAPPSGKAI